MEIISFIGLLFAFVIAITIHEAAHAWMADRLGDPTARLMGRLSLNPVVHYDQVGTTLLLVTAVMTMFGMFPFPFGWAKPVRFDPYNLQNPRKDSALISLAGPAVNIIFSTIVALALRIPFLPLSVLTPMTVFAIPIITLNVALAIFNLVPIHPLDGGKIFVGLLPEKDAREADLFLHRYGTIILLFLVFPIGGTSPIFSVLSPVIRFMLGLLIPQAAQI